MSGTAKNFLGRPLRLEETRIEKRRAFDREIGSVVLALFDPSHPDALVPAHMKQQAIAALRYTRPSHDAASDLMSTDPGISATVSIDGQHRYTFVPWDAVLWIIFEDASGKRVGIGGIWLTDVTPETSARCAREDEQRRTRLTRGPLN